MRFWPVAKKRYIQRACLRQINDLWPKRAAKQTKQWARASKTLPRSLSVTPQKLHFGKVHEMRHIHCLRQTTDL